MTVGTNGAGIMSFFQGGGNGAPNFGGVNQPTQPNTPPANGGAPGTGGTDSNQFGGVPAGGSGGAPGSNGGQQQQNSQANSQQPAPLDGFADMFKTDPQKPTVSPWESLSNPLFTPDFAELKKKVDTANFSPNLTPEQIQQLQSGNPQAYQTVFNQVAQNTFMQAVQYMHNMMDTGFKTYSGRLNDALPHRFNEFQTGLEVTKTNPLFQHEAAKPVIDGLKQLFAARMPNASPAQIAAKVNEYLKVLGNDPAAGGSNGVNNPTPNTAIDPVTGKPIHQPAQDTDWGQGFFGN